MRLELSEPATKREPDFSRDEGSGEVQTWSQKIFGCGLNSNLIHPLSGFGRAWLIVTAALLAYTAIVTPATIAFHWHDDEVMLLKAFARRSCCEPRQTA